SGFVPFTVGLGHFVLAGELDGSEVFERFVACLPEGAKGLVQELYVGLLPTQSGSMPCTTADARTLTIDNFEVVDDPTCPSPAYVIDGDFESDRASPWVANASSGANAYFIKAPDLAHAGVGAAVLVSGLECASASLQQTITVPPSSATGGPALRFF